jgi:predicted membrane protein (TIGR00267 family)
MHDIILGGQDGLVNVLGVVLGVAAASGETRLVLAAGLAAAFAESFSMTAVAYTSSVAERDYLKSTLPPKEEQAIERAIPEEAAPLKSALVVGLAAILGSLIPLLPFIWLPIKTAIFIAIVLSALSLFILGAVKAWTTMGNWKKSGTEILAIGLVAALIGYLVGLVFQV